MSFCPVCFILVCLHDDCKYFYVWQENTACIVNCSGACSWQTIAISEFNFGLYKTLKGRFSLLHCGINLPNFFIAQVGHSFWGSKDWKWSWNGGYEQCKIPNLFSFSLLLSNRHLKNIQKYVLPKFPLKQPHKCYTRPCKKQRGGARQNCTCHGVSISHASLWISAGHIPASGDTRFGHWKGGQNLLSASFSLCVLVVWRWRHERQNNRGCQAAEWNIHIFS